MAVKLIHVGRHPGRFVGIAQPSEVMNTPPAPPAPPTFVPRPHLFHVGQNPRRFLRDPQPMITPPTIVPGVGPLGAATFAMLLEQGAKVTYSWQTPLNKAWSGLEQRIATLGAPRQKYEFATHVNDTQLRSLLNALVANAPAAQPFLLGLSFEEISILGASQGTTLSTGSTSSADWLVAGQRAVVLSADWSTITNCVVQSFTSNTITVDVAIAVTNGARIMPAMEIFLDAQQSFTRYAVNAGRWNLNARAVQFGFAGSLTMGVGATVVTHGGIPVWDHGIVANDANAQPLFAGNRLADAGALIANISSYPISDWGRQLRIESDYIADWQWLKAFLSTVRGRQVAFLVPTFRPDLTPIGDASSGTLKVVGPPNANAPDYAGIWFGSLAHRFVALTTAAGVAYRQVVSATNNGDGTQSLQLDSALSGALSMVSFLEQCRLENDDIEVTWNGAVFSCDISARVVQQ